MPYKIFFTQNAGSTMSTSTDFLKPFLQSIRAGLSQNASIETDLRKPFQYHSETLWMFCFGQYGVLYQIENETQVKIFLLLHSNREEGFRESDLDELIQNLQKATTQVEELLQSRSQPISQSLEEIEETWLPNEEKERQKAKLRLELVAECGSMQAAQQFCQYFQEMNLDLADRAKYQCRAEIKQDNQQNWWCWVRPINISTIPKTRTHETLLQNLLYDRLHSAPPFHYAFSEVGMYEYVFESTNSQSELHTQLSQGNIPVLSYIFGIVMSEQVWSTIQPARRSSLKQFGQGYFWISPKPVMFSLSRIEPILEGNPQSAEEYYNNGSILMGRTQYQEALSAFEMALTLNPAFHLASTAREVAHRYLSEMN